MKKILLAVISLLLLYNPLNSRADTLKVKYYEDFSQFAHLDQKYSNPDKYLVFKFLSFNKEGNIEYEDVTLKFVVDKKWYEKNKIEDIIFLRHDQDGWQRIPYINKIVQGNDIIYSVKSNRLGEYWAVIGVLPNDKNIIATDIAANEKNKLLHKNLNFKKEFNDKKADLPTEKNIALNTLEKAVSVKGTSVATTATAAFSLIALLALLNGPANFLIAFKQLLLALIGFISSNKKVKKGIVYDAITGQPVPLVRIDIIDKKTDRIKTTKFTDKNGRYYFLVPKGEYLIEAKKKNYTILDADNLKIAKALLSKDDISREVKMSETGIIDKNIALIKEDEASSGKSFWHKIHISTIGKILFIFGFIFNIILCYFQPTILNCITLAVYILVLIFHWIFLIGSEKYGIIVNDKGEPEAFALVNIFDKKHKLIHRAITDTKGRFYIILDPGLYELEIKTSDGSSVRQKIKIKKKKALSGKLIIKTKK